MADTFERVLWQYFLSWQSLTHDILMSLFPSFLQHVHFHAFHQSFFLVFISREKKINVILVSESYLTKMTFRISVFS